ncbi:hypothetical protein [Kribbella sp. NPDC004875]|uniref:hypothetical protein n=1 Tax=Kribbella sp. NPDC004875 TaxID=3364107 RepID=UPI0036C1C9F4
MRHQVSKPRSILGNVREIRSSAIELVVLAILLALGINLISSTIFEAAGATLGAILGGALALGAAAFAAYRRLKSRTVCHEVIAVFATTRGLKYGESSEGMETKLTPIPIPDYRFGREFADGMLALFAENPAFERQWNSEPVDKPPHDHSNRNRTGGPQLVREMAEYVVLDTLSTHLTDYFNHESFDPDLLEEFSRDDVPQVVLRNRVLELFSRDFKDRPGFQAQEEEKSSGGGQIVSMYGDGGQYFNMFELTLPKGSSIERSPDGALVIRNQSVTLAIRVGFRGFATFIDREFSHLYIGIPRGIRDSGWRVEIQFEASVRRGFVAYGRNLAYHEWLDSFLEHASNRLDFEKFQEDIDWRVTRAMLRCLNVTRPRKPSEGRKGFSIMRTTLSSAGDLPERSTPPASPPKGDAGQPDDS